MPLEKKLFHYGKPIQKLFGTTIPIVQAGMVWVSGAKLAAASAQAGALGIIGAGSMKPDLLKLHIEKAKTLTSHSLAVNVPLLYEDSREQIQTALSAGIKIFFTSAGSPKKYTSWLKDQGCVVVHVTSSPELALKCEMAGVDAVVAEGFEAGGHNGRDEITTMVLIPQVKQAVKIPVIAAGGIITGEQIAAAFALGADGVQMGSRFVATHESSAHPNFKEEVLKAHSASTNLMLKALTPVRLLENKFSREIQKMESNGASSQEIMAYLGSDRAKKGMLEGDLEEGELEIGQGCSSISDILSVKELIKQLDQEFSRSLKRLQ